MKEAQKPVINVACGVIARADGSVLLAQRPEGKIAAGYWEFPGGKIERDETPLAALGRELHEELGIVIHTATPLIRFAHEYSNRRVVLDTWRVTAFDGVPQGRENQALQWLALAELASVNPLLPTVLPTIKALALPSNYVFTRDTAEPLRDLALLPQLPHGALLRLRWPQLDDAAYARIAAEWVPLAQLRGLRVMLDRAPSLVRALRADGWHGTEAAWRRLGKRPDLSLAIVSVHDAAGLARATELGFDAAVLGPVCATATHPGSAALAWSGFSALRAEWPLPVFAIGGLAVGDLSAARTANAQGIAAISNYWRS